MDKTLQDPMNQLTFGKLNRPVAESKYIVRVQAKELNWRNFLYFSGMPILPAHVLKDMNGDAYLKDYNFKLLPGSGPYTIQEERHQEGPIHHGAAAQGLLGREGQGQRGPEQF